MHVFLKQWFATGFSMHASDSMLLYVRGAKVQRVILTGMRPEWKEERESYWAVPPAASDVDLISWWKYMKMPRPRLATVATPLCPCLMLHRMLSVPFATTSWHAATSNTN